MLDSKISVIVPIYKVEKYLDRCVESIANQTYKNLEIILIDDGGTDNCPQICDKWAKKDDRIKVIHKQNGGVSSARNAGIDAATGEFIAFVDSDDWLDPTMYEDLMQEQQSKNLDLVFCRFKYRQENDDKFLQKVNEIDLKTFCETNDATYFYNHSSKVDITEDVFNIEKNVMCSIWRVLYKKSAIRDIRFSTKIRYMEDVVFLTALVCKNDKHIGYVDKYLYNYLLRKASASHKSDNAMIDNCKNYLLEMEKILAGTKYEKYLPALKFFCYSECAINKAKYGSCNLKDVKSWNTKQNYSENKKLSYGFKSRLKFFLVRHNFLLTLKVLLKIKNG